MRGFGNPLLKPLLASAAVVSHDRHRLPLPTLEDFLGRRYFLALNVMPPRPEVHGLPDSVDLMRTSRRISSRRGGAFAEDAADQWRAKMNLLCAYGLYKWIG